MIAVLWVGNKSDRKSEFYLYSHFRLIQQWRKVLRFKYRVNLALCSHINTCLRETNGCNDTGWVLTVAQCPSKTKWPPRYRQQPMMAGSRSDMKKCLQCWQCLRKDTFYSSNFRFQNATCLKLRLQQRSCESIPISLNVCKFISLFVYLLTN